MASLIRTEVEGGVVVGLFVYLSPRRGCSGVEIFY